MNSGYSEPPDIVNFLPGPLEFTITRVHCICIVCVVKDISGAATKCVLNTLCL